MSIEAMVRAWEKSAHRGTRLLTLLALADYCNNESLAWPKVATIATRIRSTPRQTQGVLRALENSGELYSHMQTGRTHPNFYLVAVGLDAPRIEEALVDFLLYPQELAQHVATLLLAGQEGRNIKDALADVEQPFTVFFQVRRLIVAQRRRVKETAPFKKKQRVKEPAPLLAGERAKDVSGRGEQKAVKGEDGCTHEPITVNHEPFVIEALGDFGDYCNNLLPWFINISGLPLPRLETAKGRAELARRWIAPLNRVGELAAFVVDDVKELFLWGLNYADREGWGNKVYAPGSVERPIVAENARRERQEGQGQAMRAAAAELAPELPELPPPDEIPPELEEAYTMWREIKGDLSLQMTSETFNTWLKTSSVIRQENGAMHVQVDNAYIKEWLDNRLKQTVEKAADFASQGAITEVLFSVKPPASK